MSQAPRTRRVLTPLQKRNRALGVVVAVVAVGMIGAAYAAVPLYKAFCQATGYDGTVSSKAAAVAPGKVLNDTLLIRFDVNVRDLPWDFTTEQVSQTMKVGETKVALFKVTNNSDKAVTGRAVFNVVPEQVGGYFRKLSCFCFSDQTLQPHQTVEMPVLYFVDPKIKQDPETAGDDQITLSYTFYPATDVKPKTAAAGSTEPVG